MGKYIEIPHTDVPERLKTFIHDAVRLIAPELELGTLIYVRWMVPFERATRRQRDSMRPGAPMLQSSSVHTRGFIGPWVKYSADRGWYSEPESSDDRPSIFLDPVTAGPTTILHELRHRGKSRTA